MFFPDRQLEITATPLLDSEASAAKRCLRVTSASILQQSQSVYQAAVICRAPIGQSQPLGGRGEWGVTCTVFLGHLKEQGSSVAMSCVISKGLFPLNKIIIII